jgi:hypothetical protein
MTRKMTSVTTFCILRRYERTSGHLVKSLRSVRVSRYTAFYTVEVETGQGEPWDCDAIAHSSRKDAPVDFGPGWWAPQVNEST